MGRSFAFLPPREDTVSGTSITAKEKTVAFFLSRLRRNQKKKNLSFSEVLATLLTDLLLDKNKDGGWKKGVRFNLLLLSRATFPDTNTNIAMRVYERLIGLAFVEATTDYDDLDFIIDRTSHTEVAAAAHAKKHRLHKLEREGVHDLSPVLIQRKTPGEPS